MTSVEVVGHKRHANGTARFTSNLVALHVGETVVEQRKDGRCDLVQRPSPVQRPWSIDTFMGSGDVSLAERTLQIHLVTSGRPEKRRYFRSDLSLRTQRVHSERRRLFYRRR